jgi:DNA-binding NtrC family response regulator
MIMTEAMNATTRGAVPGESAPPRILIADDQPDVLQALRLLLKGEGYQIETATSPAQVSGAVTAHEFDVLLLDMNYARDTTSGREGLDLLTRIHAVYPQLPVIVMTAWGSVDGAVEAMRRGARDYVEKPWDNQRLLATLRTQVELGRALRRSERLEDENRHLRGEGLPRLIADSRVMQPVLRIMERIGPSDANVLITGEHGTGKEVVARWLHAASGRARKPRGWWTPARGGGGTRRCRFTAGGSRRGCSRASCSAT